MHRRIYALLMPAVLLCLATSVYGWWDTAITTYRTVPLQSEHEAEALGGFEAAAVVTDAQADGGRGGQAVVLTPGGEGQVVLEAELEPSLYLLYVIAREPEGRVGNGLIRLEVTEHASGQTREWSMICVYRDHYAAVGQLYFPAYRGGRYTAKVSLLEHLEAPLVDPEAMAMLDAETLGLRAQSPRPLWVDRLEIRDVFAALPKQAVKTRRVLTSDAELAAMRRAFTEAEKPRVLRMGRDTSFFLTGERKAAWAEGRSAEERQARNEELWAMLPDFNAHVSHHYGNPYSTIIGRDRNGLVADAADNYEATGHPEIGMDGAVLLLAVAEKYPALDYFAQGAGRNTNLSHGQHDNGQPFRFNNPAGKSVYRGWAGSDATRLVTSYDKLFDFIKGNQEVADFLATKIPGIQTPQDVIRYLDTRMLQHMLDAAARDQVSGSDALKALIPVVQGVHPISDAMLDRGVFTKLSMDMTFRGGVDDHAFCSYSRDGVHYIGSVGYLNTGLQKIADVLSLYRRQGGDARFDLSDATLYPQMRESQRTIEQLRLAGGFRLVQGDAGDLRLPPEKDVPAYPSRVLGGFGATLVETAQFQEDPLRKRGMGIYFGIGRGHSHQDTLNLELFAHGARVAPDLGGRHEGRNRGAPNMRSNRVHNLVEVDYRNFHNLCPGSTTSGTGWNTSFQPATGSQFVEHHARATSHPDVTLYQRQTAMVDSGPADSYFFDVFRVRGGQVHSYNFHGGPTDALATNVELEPATSETALRVLRNHKEGTRVEGIAPAMVQADWPLDQAVQKRYQGDHYQADRPLTTRLALFGTEGRRVMVGNATSEKYAYDFPFLYLEGDAASEGKPAETAFVALIEPFVGTSRIVSKRRLAVQGGASGAEAPAALEVKLDTGVTDLLLASVAGGGAVTAEGGLSSDGKYSLVSRDSEGLRMAHLVAGTTLRQGDLTIEAERPRWEARITGVAYDDLSLTVDAELPVALLAGEVLGIGPAQQRIRHSFNAVKLEAAPGGGTTIRYDKTARYYQSTVVRADSAEGTVECEIEPVTFGPDSRFAEGTTVSNETQSRFWKASNEEGDRWMHLGYPGYRTSTPVTIAMEDVVDANGDGRRELTLIGRESDGDKEDKPLLKLEVTRVAPGGETFYFKLPEDERYQRGGWQYANRRLVNEDGSRAWTSLYPGSSVLWRLDGPVSESDFPDGNGDGKAKLIAYLFGPGDVVEVDTSVALRRLEDGRYELEANVPCTVTLSRDGKAVTKRFGAADLGEGKVVFGL